MQNTGLDVGSPRSRLLKLSYCKVGEKTLLSSLSSAYPPSLRMSRIGDVYTSVTVPAANVDYALSESSDNFLHFYISGYNIYQRPNFFHHIQLTGFCICTLPNRPASLLSPLIRGLYDFKSYHVLFAVLSYMQMWAALGLLPRLRYAEVRRYVICQISLRVLFQSNFFYFLCLSFPTGGNCQSFPTMAGKSIALGSRIKVGLVRACLCRNWLKATPACQWPEHATDTFGSVFDIWYGDSQRCEMGSRGKDRPRAVICGMETVLT